MNSESDDIDLIILKRILLFLGNFAVQAIIFAIFFSVILLSAIGYHENRTLEAMTERHLAGAISMSIPTSLTFIFILVIIFLKRIKWKIKVPFIILNCLFFALHFYFFLTELGIFL